MIFLYYLFDGGVRVFKKRKKTFWRRLNMVTIFMVMVVSHLHTHTHTHTSFQVMHFGLYSLLSASYTPMEL